MEEVDLIIDNVILVSKSTLCEPVKCSIVVSEGQVIDVDKPENIRGKYNCDEHVDGKGYVAVPGFVNAHLHSYGTIFRGLGEEMTLHEIDSDEFLRSLMEYIGRTKPRDLIYYACMVTYIEALKSGAIFIADIPAWSYTSNIMVEALNDLGLRGFVVYNVDAWKERKISDGIVYGIRIPEEEKLEREDLEKVRDVISSDRSVMVHMHVAETIERYRIIREKFGLSTVELLDAFNLLSSRSILTHAIWLSDRDRRIIARRKASIVSTPSAEMKLSDGIAQIPYFISDGINVALGTDGALWNNCNDIILEMKMLCLLQKVTFGVRAISGRDAFIAATYAGARAFKLENIIGDINKGYEANIVLINIENPSLKPLIMAPRNNVLSNLVYCAHSGCVDKVIVRGELYVDDGTLVKLDEAEILGKFQKEVEKIFSKIE